MRDPEIQNRYGNTFQVVFPDFPGFVQPPYSITLTQHVGHHDIVELFYNMYSTNYVKTLATGVAVQVNWANDNVAETFIGYVSDVKYPTTSAIQKHLKVVLMGASYPLREKVHKIWKNVTASEAATEIAKANNLMPVVTQSDIRLPQISFTGHSQWQKLQELAKRVGFACQVRGVELHFHPIDVMIDKSITVMPVMSFLDPTVNPMNQFASQTLDGFETVQTDAGSFNGNDRATKVVGGVDPITGKMYKTTSSPKTVGKNLRQKTKDPLFFDIDTSVVVTDGLTAQSLSNAKANLSRLSVPGYGFGQGDPRIAPWRTVEVRGTGESSDGYWIVTKAVHTMNADGKYTVEFNCATDGSGANLTSAVRPSNAGSVPTVDLNDAITTGANLVTRYKLSDTQPMISQSSTGYKILPRRWVAA